MTPIQRRFREASRKKKEAGLSSGLSRTKRFQNHLATALAATSVIGCGAADIRLTSHTEHCAFASQRRHYLTPIPVPRESPLLGTGGCGSIYFTYADSLFDVVTTREHVIRGARK